MPGRILTLLAPLSGVSEMPRDPNITAVWENGADVFPCQSVLPRANSVPYKWPQEAARLERDGNKAGGGGGWGG